MASKAFEGRLKSGRPFAFPLISHSRIGIIEVVVNTDGNITPGPCLGFVIRDKNGFIIRQGGLRLPKDLTSNECEYSAVVTALYNCHKLGATEVMLKADSQLIVRQLQGIYAVRQPHLMEYHAEITDMMKSFKKVTFEWIPRKQNELADKVARAAWEGAE